MTRERKNTVPCEPPRNLTLSEEIFAVVVGTSREASQKLQLEEENRELRRRLAEREQELQQLIDEKEGVHV